MSESEQERLAEMGQQAPLAPLEVLAELDAHAAELVVLRVGRRWFGVQAGDVREVVIKGYVTPMPLSASHVQGIAQVHGRLVPVVDMAYMVTGLGRGESAAMLPRMVIVAEGELEVAIVADEARGLIDVALQRAPSAEAAPWVNAEVTWEAELVYVIDVPAFIRAAMARR